MSIFSIATKREVKTPEDAILHAASRRGRLFMDKDAAYERILSKIRDKGRAVSFPLQPSANCAIINIINPNSNEKSLAFFGQDINDCMLIIDEWMENGNPI